MKKVILVFFILVPFGILAQNIITIDTSKEYQTIEGLGGYGPYTMYPAMHFKQVADNLGASLIRINIPDDFITSEENLDSAILNDSIESATWLNTDYMKKISERSPDMKFIANVWSPPAFMKKNKSAICSCCVGYNKDSKCDSLNYLIPAYYYNYAAFLGMYTKTIKKSTGRDIYAIGLQNEPMFNEPYPSSLLYAPSYAACLRTVGAYFAKDTQLAKMKFYGPEHMCDYPGNSGGQLDYWGKPESSKYIQYLLDDDSTRRYMHAYAVHGYVNGVSLDIGSVEGWTAFSSKTNAYGKKMWMTETGMSDNGWNGIFNSAKGIFLSLKYGQVSAWSYWVLSDNLFTSNLPDFRTGVAKQFFRFIRPGYVCVDVVENIKGIAAIAFKNDSDMTIVIMNEGTTQQIINIQNAIGTTLPASYQMYRSSATEMCVYLGSTGDSLVIPSKSIITLYYKAAEPDQQWSPNMPKDVRATEITVNSARLTWEAPDSWKMKSFPSDYIVNTNGYYVYKKNADGSWSMINNGAINKLYYDISLLKPGIKYTYGVVSRDELYNLSAKKEITFVTPCYSNCPDTMDIPWIDDSDISVFPNPSYGEIVVENAEKSSIQVFDITGKLIISHENAADHTTISLYDVPSGNYIVKIIRKNTVVIKKIQLL